MSVYFASAQVTGLGPCPVVKPVENFNVNKYTGLWYEFQKYPNFFSRGAKCITATYQLLNDGNVSVFNQQVVNGAADGIKGYASLVSSGLLSVSFPTVPCNFLTFVIVSFKF